MSCGIETVATERGRRIAVARRIQAPAESSWDLFSTVHRWPEWGPAVTAIDCQDERVTTDTEGRVQLFGSVWAPFEITSVDGHSWTWRVWGRTPPADGHRVEQADATTSRAVLELPTWAP